MFYLIAQTNLHCKLLPNNMAPNQVVVGIPRETVNPWERRAVLTPDHVSTLVRKGIRVLVQPSDRRIFAQSEYVEAGAEVKEDLSEASVIMGVKRPCQLTTESLIPNKTYAFFTHTIKAQEDNMELLDTLLERNIRIVDYECMVDENDRRVLAFGKFAGYSGMVNALHGLGQRLLALGYTTPFMTIAMPQTYSSLEMAKQAIKNTGYEIAMNKMPSSIGPLIFLFTGYGNVSKGAQELFRLLPHKYITPAEMKEIATNGRTDIVYGVEVGEPDHLRHKETGKFDMKDFRSNPQNYKSVFAKEIAPYMSVMINGIYWGVNDPRINVPNAPANLSTSCFGSNVIGCPPLPQRLIAVCDISADPNGSLQFMQECTTIEKPFEFSDRLLNTHLLSPSIAGEGFLVCSIDNMPSQIPVEASNYFGDRLMPWHLMQQNHSNVIKPAVIASNGRLTPRFQYIDTLRRQNEARGHKVLILGAGFVVPSIVGYLIRDPNTSKFWILFRLIVAKVDEVAEDECLGKLISRHDLVVIMTPWKFHTKVINACIAHKKNFLTASYCSPELRKLETAIENAGIIGVMEMGLDPGIDHMLAMECFDEVYRRGGKVISYKSYTGGLPAPEFADNPLRYKFSWSPEAAMSTVLNSALYLEDGKRKEIAAGGDLMDAAQRMNDLIGFNLESYPNRDSISYKDVYKLKDCETVIRGTIRYKGFAKVVRALINLGFMDTKEHPKLAPGAPSLTWVAQMANAHNFIPMFKKLILLEILSDKVAELKGSPFATISQHFADIMAYGPNERDLIVMSHQIGIEWPDKRRELRVVRLVVYGEAGKGKAGLAMSRTVGIPAAIAARMILDGKIQRKGYVLPLTSDIYEPILEELKNEGIQATEVTVPL
ncbi:unnamed protein product [Mesocestoides corti]|uniref:Uncharacterized protein n=1 Tax=Mesocestoides corti TaxID=53468 RepID=A0A0R3U7Q3_MESCO|nr:unnamed protein product [Mesocestoides corti]